MQPERDDERAGALFRALARALLLAAGLVVGLWLLYRIRRVLLFFMLALVGALVLNVPVGLLERRGLPRPAATAVVALALAALAGGLGWLVLPRLVHEVPQFIDQLPALLGQIVARASDYLQGQPLLVRQLSRLADWVVQLLSQLWRYAGALVATLVLSIVLTAMTLFLVANPRPLLAGFLRAVPPHLREPAARAFARASAMVVGWVGANLVLGAIKATLTFLFLSWMGIGPVALWSVLAFFSSLLPAVGFYLMSIPPSILALAQSPLHALWTILFFWGMSEILGDFVAPHLWARTMRLHPVFLLFMVLAMAVTFGAAGVLIAIPAGGFLKAFFDELYLFRQPEDPQLDRRIDAILARKAPED